VLQNFLKIFSDQINGVIHVGAHLGQEVTLYNEYGINKIYLFEPQKKIFEKLNKNMKKHKHVCCYNFALGSENKLSTLNLSNSNFGLSSSILSPQLHLKVQPKIEFTETENIIIKRFDNLDILPLNFLTIDVQGFELEVLKGFGDLITDVEFIFTEINTKSLYKDNALVKDIDRYLSQFNFERIYTNIDCFKFYGDAFYLKRTNPLFEKLRKNKILNKIFISNSYLTLKKILYPVKLFKLSFNL